jgi:hypothetical protein
MKQSGTYRIAFFSSSLLVVALFLSLLVHAPGATDLNWQLFALCVAHKFARLLLDVAGRARRFVDCAALLFATSVAHFDLRIMGM